MAKLLQQLGIEEAATLSAAAAAFTAKCNTERFYQTAVEQ